MIQRKKAKESFNNVVTVERKKQNTETIENASEGSSIPGVEPNSEHISIVVFVHSY